MGTSLGEMIREARATRFKLREFAAMLSISPTHLSDIEHNRRTPSEEVLRRIAQELGLDLGELLDAAGRLGDDTERYAQQVPEAAALFRKVSQRGLGPKELSKLNDMVDGFSSRKRGRGR